MTPMDDRDEVLEGLAAMLDNLALVGDAITVGELDGFVTAIA